MFTTTCESFIAIEWTVRAPVGKMQHRVLQLVQFLNFLNFQSHFEYVYNNWKFHRNRMNAVCSCRATPGTPASTIFILILFLIYKNHREHVYNNFWKCHRNWVNGVSSCTATPGTPASTIFKFSKFPKPSRAGLQILKVSSQSDERCVLL